MEKILEHLVEKFKNSNEYHDRYERTAFTIGYLHALLEDKKLSGKDVLDIINTVFSDELEVNYK